MRNAMLVGALLLPILAGAPPTPAAAQTVSILGCVSRGVEVGCLVITDRKTGKTYQINGAQPQPDPAKNLVVRLEGKIAHLLDFCQQGAILQDITWSYTRTSCTKNK